MNQDSAYRPTIASDDGLVVPFRGVAASDIGSAHYEFHASLEEFWEQFRRGTANGRFGDGARFGDKPTNAEYSDALYKALRAAGLNGGQARYLQASARAQRLLNNLGDSDPVPNVPGRMYQKQRP